MTKARKAQRFFRNTYGFSRRNVVGDDVAAGAAACKEGKGSFGASPGPVWRSGFDDRSWRTGWSGHPWRWGIVECNVMRRNMNGTVDREGYLS